MWAMFSEIFPNRLRGLAISLAGFFNSLVSYTVQQVFPWELSNHGAGRDVSDFRHLRGLWPSSLRCCASRKRKAKSLEQLEEILVRTN